jgi:Type II secretion system (T2SS), protein E, N-terminal domain
VTVRTEPADLTRAELAGLLVSQGLISDEERDWALAVQERTGSPLSVVLITAGLVQRQRLYQALAGIWGTGFIDLAAHPPDPELLAGLDPDRLVRHGWVPVRTEPDGTVLVAGPHPPAGAARVGDGRRGGRAAGRGSPDVNRAGADVPRGQRSA